MTHRKLYSGFRIKMTSSQTYELSISEAGDLLKKKELSPIELVEDHIKRIETKDNALNSFITKTFDKAIDRAKDCEEEISKGQWKGALHGIPLAIKDLFYTKDIPTTVGSEMYKQFIPDFNATVVEKLESSGAILIGKLNMHELAFGTTGKNFYYGDCTNPWDTKKITGGSSSGSAAAVSAGLCMGSLGTDTGGSIRIPAALCGIVGLKPTFGKVSRKGVFPLSNSLDTVGPMTRTVQDSQIILSAISGHDPQDRHSAKFEETDIQVAQPVKLEDLKIAVPTDYFFDHISDSVNTAFNEVINVLQSLGIKTNNVNMPILNHSLAISSTILMAEAANIHGENLKKHGNLIGPDVLLRLKQGSMILASDYLQAQRARQKFNLEMKSLFDDYDLILSPTVAVTAPDLSQELVSINGKSHATGALMPRLTRPQNITGLPTISIPCGFDEHNMPIGFQLTTAAFQESRLIQVGAAYEKEAGWLKYSPNI